MKTDSSEKNKIQITIDGEKLSLYDFFSVDSSSIDRHKNIFFETLQKYKNMNNKDSSLSIEIDILQPMLFFTSSKYFQDYYYIEPIYYPPYEFSEMFYEVTKESFKKSSDFIIYEEPYHPLVHLGEVDQIYHYKLTRDFLLILKQKLEDKASLASNVPQLKSNYILLKTMILSALKEEVVILVQLTP